MNKKQQFIAKKQVLRQYHLPGSLPRVKPTVNVVYLSAANTILYELYKAKICHLLRCGGKDFITEAVDVNSGKRRDIVCINDGEIYEVVVKNDKPEVLAEYKRDHVNIEYATWEGLQKPDLI